VTVRSPAREAGRSDAIERHEELYYKHQTRARGLLDAGSLQARFDKLARWYARRLGPFLPPGPDTIWIDLPCGYGNFLYFLRSRGYRNVTGYDADPEQVRLARMLELPAREGDARRVVEDTSLRVEAIASVDFIEHLSRDDAVQFLRSCRERLPPGGVLILRTPCADGPFGSRDAWNDLTHRWASTSNLLRALLEMVGFEQVRILDERPQPYDLVGFFRLMAFYPARALASAFALALGVIPPRVWSTSMWAVARTPRDRDS
jgi:SAM-dependent methyltransferase